VEVINDALDEGPTRSKEAITSDKLEQDRYIDRILGALQRSSDMAMDKTLSSKNMTWLAVLSSLFKQTYEGEKPDKSTERWRFYIGSALRCNRIEWVLGNSRGTITATIAERVFPSKEKSSLVGWAMSLHPGSLKRSAVMAEIARESKRHRAKESRIDFGCKFPLGGGLPAELERGFQQLQENSKHMKMPKAGLTNHYRQAHRLLEAYQGKPQVELLCMLALTVGTTSDMIVYNMPKADAEGEVAGFAVADSKVKHKRGGTRVALLALRMLWFLEPGEFVWKKAKGAQERKMEEATMYSTQYVREATGETQAPTQPLPHV
jgi:hypothetical protein